MPGCFETRRLCGEPHRRWTVRLPERCRRQACFVLSVPKCNLSAAHQTGHNRISQGVENDVLAAAGDRLFAGCQGRAPPGGLPGANKQEAAPFRVGDVTSEAGRVPGFSQKMPVYVCNGKQRARKRRRVKSQAGKQNRKLLNVAIASLSSAAPESSYGHLHSRLLLKLEREAILLHGSRFTRRCEGKSKPGLQL
jgi:hypothetical protein